MKKVFCLFVVTMILLMSVMDVVTFADVNDANEQSFYFQNFSESAVENLSELGISAKPNRFFCHMDSGNKVLAFDDKGYAERIDFTGAIGAKVFKPGVSLLEDSDNVIVFSYDAYIPNFYDQKQVLYSFVGYGDENGNKSGKWMLGLGAKLQMNYEKKRIISGFDYRKDNPQTQLTDGDHWITQSGANAKICLPNTSDSDGQWVNFKITLQYDPVNKTYNSSNYINNQPIKTGNGNIAVFETNPDENYAKKIRDRGSFVFYICGRNGEPEKNNGRILIDNVLMSVYDKTELQPLTNSVSKTKPVVFISQINSFYGGSDVPDEVLRGAIDSKMIDKNHIKVLDGKKDITEKCNIHEQNNGFSISTDDELENEVLTIKSHDLKDIYGNSISDQEFHINVLNQQIEAGSLTYTINKEIPIFDDYKNFALTLNWKNVDSNNEKMIDVSIMNYNGDEVYSSKEKINAGETSYILKLPGLPFGWYKLQVQFEKESVDMAFSIVKPAKKRRNTDKLELGMHAWLGNSEYIDRAMEVIDEFIDSVKLLGIHKVRSGALLKYYHENSENNWYAKYFNNLNADINKKLQQNGIDVLVDVEGRCSDGIFDGNCALPDDLEQAYGLMKKFAAKQQENIDVLEIWNEPDYRNNVFLSDKEGPDKYASFFKAAAIAMRDAGYTGKLSFAPFCGMNASYVNRLLANDIYKYSDTYSFHDYSSYGSGTYKYSQDRMKEHVNLANAYGFADKPKIMSEYNEFMYNSDVNYDLSMMLHQARYGIKNVVHAYEAGVDTPYLFQFFYHKDGNLGMLDLNRHPKPVYNALSAFTNSIGNGKIVGKINNVPTNVEAYLFYDEMTNESVICYWADQELNVTFDLGIKESSIIDFFGNEYKTYHDDGLYCLNVNEDIGYIRFSGSLQSDMVTKISKTAVSDNNLQLSNADRVVLMQEFEDDTKYSAKSSGYGLSDGTNKIRLKITNFNDKEIDGIIFGNVYNGWELSERERSVIVPARGTVTLEYTVKPKDEFGVGESPLSFYGVFNGEKGSVSTSTIYSKQSYRAANLIPQASSAANWVKNNNRETLFSVSDANDDSVDFNYVFAGNNIWAFPVLDVQEGAFAQTDGIGAYYKCDADLSGAYIGIYIVDNDNTTYFANKNFINSSDWHTLSFNWNDFSVISGSVYKTVEPEKIVKIRFGVYGVDASRGQDNIINATLSLKQLGGYKNEFRRNPEISTVEYNVGKLKVLCDANKAENRDATVYVDNRTYTAPITDNVAVFPIALMTNEADVAIKVTNSSGFSTYKKFRVSGSRIKIFDFELLEIGEYVAADVKMQNYTDQDVHLCLYVARYDNDSNELTDINMTSIELNKNEKTQVSARVSVPIKYNSYYQAFLWKEGSLTPIIKQMVN